MQKHQNRIIWMVALINFMMWPPAQATMAESAILSIDSASMGIDNEKSLPIETEFTISGGYRRDDLDWNIAGDTNGNHPNILSELTWDDVESYQVKFQGNLIWPKIMALRGSVAYGWIFDGENQDSDYRADNRNLEFSRSNNSTEDGYVWDASLAVGYPLRFGRTVVGTFIPLVGYSHHEQLLDLTDGYQTIPDTGPFPGLDSSYDTQWQGPWVGFDLRFRSAEIKALAHRIETYFTYEFHWADYEAEADWNLRDDLAHPKSFKHNTDGDGFIIGAGLNCVLNQYWALNVNFDYQDWSTDNGTSKVFFADGTTAKTQLNEVNWTSYALMVGLSLRF
ncbi:MAG: hypothetical protein WBM69_02935 [Desulfobacterales bacterium]